MAFGKGHHLHLVDGSAFIFRAYHALPPLTRKSDGLPIGAVSGFCNMLWNQIIKDHGADAPTHAAVVFDKGSHTFRNDLYDLYKANRDEMPEDLRPQIPLTRDATRAFNLACLELEGLRGRRHHRHARPPGARGGGAGDDHLLGQGPDAAGGRRGRDVRRDEEHAHRREGVEAKFGVGPDKVIDVQALAGRQRRQHSRRAGHRGEDGGASDQRIRRSRHAAGARRGDQAAQAAPDPDRECRADPPVAHAGDARRQCADGRDAGRPGGAGARGRPR
jgi:hypothetical protein